MEKINFMKSMPWSNWFGLPEKESYAVSWNGARYFGFLVGLKGNGRMGFIDGSGVRVWSGVRLEYSADSRRVE